jgi:hypothetical protein
MQPPPPRFVIVLVEEHDELPDGCCMRFKIVSEPKAVHRVRYEADDSPESLEWSVESPNEDGSAGTAWAAEVEDSGAGTSTLVYGGSRGLRLRPEERSGTVEPRAEPYLLIGRDAILS